MCSQVLKLFISVIFIANQISAIKGKHQTEKSDDVLENFDPNTFDFNSPESSKYLKNEVQQKDAVTYELGAPQYQILNPHEPPEIIMHGQPNYFDNLKRYGQLTGEEEREFGDVMHNSTDSNKNETKTSSETVEVKQPNLKIEEAHEKVDNTKNEENKEILKKEQDKFVVTNQNQTEPNYNALDKDYSKEAHSEKQSDKTDTDYQQKHNDRQLEHDQKEHKNSTSFDSELRQHGESTSQVKSQHENAETTEDIQAADDTSTSEHHPSNKFNNKLGKSYPTAPSPGYYQNYQTQDMVPKVASAPRYSTTYTNNDLYQEVQKSITTFPSNYPKYQPEFQMHRSGVTTIPVGYYPNYRPNIQPQRSTFEYTRAPQQHPNYQEMSPSLYSYNNYRNNYKSIQPPHLRDLEQLYREALESHHRLGRSHNSQHFHHPYEKQIYPREKYYYYIIKKS